MLKSVAKQFKFPARPGLLKIAKLGGRARVQKQFSDPRSGVMAEIQRKVGRGKGVSSRPAAEQEFRGPVFRTGYGRRPGARLRMRARLPRRLAPCVDHPDDPHQPVDSRVLGDFGQAALEEGTLGLVRRQLDCAPVGHGCLRWPLEPPEQIRPGRVEEAVVLEAFEGSS